MLAGSQSDQPATSTAVAAAAIAAKKQYLEKCTSLRNREAALASDLDSWVQVHGAEIVIDLATAREPASAAAAAQPAVKGKGKSASRRPGNPVPWTVVRFGNSGDPFPQGHARLKSLLKTLNFLQHQQQHSQSQHVNVPHQPTLMEQIHRTFTQVEESMHLAHKALMEESQSLALQEKQLSHDLAMVENRLRALDAASTDFTVDHAPAPSSSTVAAAAMGKVTSKPRLVPTNTLPPEVIEFETYAEKHGPTGGWDPYAHDVFVSALKHTCPSMLSAAYTTEADLGIDAQVKSQHVSRCAEALGVPESDVEVHWAWWIEMQRLQVRKRRAIEVWRQRKQQKQQHKPVDDAAVAEADPKTDVRGGGVDEEKATEQMLKVAEWRLEKERRRIEEERAEMERQRWVQEAENERRMKRQEELKQLVKDYKLRKAATDDRSHTPTSRASTPRPSISPTSLARIQAKNQALTDRRRALALEKLAAQSTAARPWNDQEDGDNGHVFAIRDPMRALAPTSAWQARVAESTVAASAREREAQDRFRVTSGARALPRRAVPGWRAGVS